MSTEDIDHELGKILNFNAPSTVADALTLAFDKPELRHLVATAPGIDTFTVKMDFSFTVSMAVAKAHLGRLLQVEARGEPGNHALFMRGER